jgi:phosphoglycolate phosphatase
MIDKEYDSLIFDLDGTLWDATEGIRQSWNYILEHNDKVKRDPISVEELGSCMGLVMYDIAAKLFPAVEKKVRDSLMDELCLYENQYLSQNGGDLYPDLESSLKILRQKYRLFIVSNCQDGYIEAFLESSGLGYLFEDTECWGRTRLSKDKSNKILIERNDLKNPVYIGDTASDAKAAHDAGVDFIYASYGFGNVEEGQYVEKVEKFKELIDKL